MMARQILDAWVAKLVSRKLLVWATSTGFLVADLITSEQWVAVALAYVGVEGFADIAIRWKSARNNTPQD
jgi:hypothetical protein|tara:strand:- start:530 stop:739 length:210 start_codon:yes stop_codon:yes gene_type:complete